MYIERPKPPQVLEHHFQILQYISDLCYPSLNNLTNLIDVIQSDYLKQIVEYYLSEDSKLEYPHLINKNNQYLFSVTLAKLTIAYHENQIIQIPDYDTFKKRRNFDQICARCGNRRTISFNQYACDLVLRRTN